MNIRYSKLNVFFVVSSLTTSLAASYSPLLEEIDRFDPDDLKAMQEMHPQEAALLLVRLNFDYNLRLPEAEPFRRALAQEFLKHPQMEEWIVKLLRETPRHYDAANKIGWVWGPLELMRASWVVRLLGEELMDDTPFSQPGVPPEEVLNQILSRNWHSENYQNRAIRALMHLDLPYMPFDETSPRSHNLTRTIDEWKTWYVEHGEEVIAQLEAEEAEREELEIAAAAEAKAKAERYEARHRNPPSPPESLATETEEPKLPTPRRAIIAAFVLVFTSIALLLFARTKRRQSLLE